MSKSETGVQLLARLGARPSLEGLEENVFIVGPKGGDVFEFYGEEGVGKTELFLHFVVKIILPKSWKTFKIGGYGSKVVFIDTDYKFQILRLTSILECNIKNVTTATGSNKEITDEVTSDEIEELVQTCLKNIQIIRITSNEQLLWTLHGLSNLFSFNPEIGIMMIDSISTFYYTEKCNNTLDTNVKHIIDVLNHLITEFNLIVFVTKAALVKQRMKISSSTASSNQSDDQFQYTEFLGNKWHSFVQKRFIMIKEMSQNKMKFSINCKQFKSAVAFRISDLGVEFQ